MCVRERIILTILVFHTDTDGNCTNFDQMIAMRILCMRNYGNTKPVTILFSNQVKIMRWLFANKTCKRSLLPFKKVAIVVVQLSLFIQIHHFHIIWFCQQVLRWPTVADLISPNISFARFRLCIFRNLFVFIDWMCVLCTKIQHSHRPMVASMENDQINFEARTG